MIRDRSFVVFADDWGRHPSSAQHLFARIAPGNRVAWVNTIGTRMPGLNAADLRRAAEKLAEWTGRGGAGVARGNEPGTTSADRAVTVLRPFMTPFDRWRPLRALNRHLLSRALRRSLPEAGVHDPILVTTIPNAAGVVGALGEVASVYYCVDEFSEWPGADRETMLAMERELLRKVDLVIATSDALFESKSALHPRVRLLAHGVDWERFRAAEGNAPPALASIPRPRFGFTGLVDDRLNTELVAELANGFEEASFVFVGPRQLGPSPLDALANVHFLPPVSYQDVPAVLAAFDVAILPYRENALTERINPLKLREFLASGIPVVATPLPEVLRFSEWLEAPRSGPAWAGALRAALTEGRARSAARSEAVRGDGWDSRAERFCDFLAEVEPEARTGPPAASRRESPAPRRRARKSGSVSGGSA